jgi:hypothetical protein
VIFYDEFIADENQIRSVLDYVINIRKLKPKDQYYVALTGTSRGQIHKGILVFDRDFSIENKTRW